MKKSLVLIIVFLLVVHATCFSFAEELDRITDDDSINSTGEENEIGSEEEELFDIDSESNQQEETEEILAPEDNNQPNEEIDEEEFVDDNSTAEELEGEEEVEEEKKVEQEDVDFDSVSEEQGKEEFSPENIALEEANIEPIETLEKETYITTMRSAAPQTRSVQNGWDASGTHYYINGVAQRGFVEIEGRTYYFNNAGEFKIITGLVKNAASEWKYVRNGIVDYNAVGLVQNIQEGHQKKGKYFYVENGVFKNDAFGLVKGIQPNSEVKGNWYYVQNGEYKETGTGLVQNIQADHQNKGKYYYIENGKWKKTENGFYHPEDDKNYAIKNGAWLEGYNGLYKNPVNNKYYYLENGIWERDYNGAIRVEDASGSSYWCHIKNGMKLDRTTITYFRQSAGSWASKKYGGKTFADTGCVPTSLAMVISAIQNSVVYPDTVGDYLYRINEFNGKTSGVTGAGTIKGADAWKVNYSYIHSNSDMDAVLRAGKVLIVNVGPGTWCGTGATHAIVCDGYSNGRTYVYDPAHPDRNGWYATGKVYANPSTDSNDYAGGTNIFAFW